MPIITFNDRHYDCESGETVLESLARQGAAIPSSCRSGACQTCLMRAAKGTPPAKSQQGLQDNLRARNYFLACTCIPESDLHVALPAADAVNRVSCRVVAKERLNREIIRLVLQCREPMEYYPGQFIHLHRADGLMRSYSLANVPTEENLLELHVRRLPDGRMSGWIHKELAVGDSLEAVGPVGNCFYLPTDPTQRLLLVGTGSGLAPLWGILRDALRQGHVGTIRLFHGSWNPAGLYLVDELREAAAKYPNFIYTPCVDSEPEDGLTEGRVDAVVFSQLKDLKGWRVFVCGHPEIARTVKKKAFLAGASMQAIHSDPFVLAAPPAPSAPDTMRAA